MAGRLDEIRAAGARLMLVGNGSPGQAAKFAKGFPGVTVLTDPSLDTYRALGLRRGVGATLNPGSALSAVGAALRGNRQTSVEGDPWQQGGLLLLGPGGQVLYLQRNRGAGDRPDLDRALAVLGVGRKPVRRGRPEVT